MDINHTVAQIFSRVKEFGHGVSFTYDEINDWLNVSCGDDLMWIYDRLSERLMVEHSTDLELKEDCIVAVKTGFQ